MEALSSLQGNPATLDQISTIPNDGGPVPLVALARWTTRPIQSLPMSHQGRMWEQMADTRLDGSPHPGLGKCA
jgi:hypothetical protein